MVVTTDRRLYVSTDKGLFQARSNGGGYQAQPLAFDHYAPMRWGGRGLRQPEPPVRRHQQGRNGTGPASVFKSLDRGESWIDSEQFRTMPESIDWTLPPAPHIAHVKGLAVCASDPRVVFGAVEERR